MQGRISFQTVQEGDSERLLENLTHVVGGMSEFRVLVFFEFSESSSFFSRASDQKNRQSNSHFASLSTVNIAIPARVARPPIQRACQDSESSFMSSPNSLNPLRE